MFVSDPYFIQSPGAEEVQTITITGSPTGGTYTLTFSGQTTGNIAYNANAATIQTALLALSNLDTGDVVVTGTGPFTVTFGGDWVNVNVPQITATASLTGGTSPGVVTATTTQGSGLTDNTFQTLAEKSFVMTLDCATASVTAVIP